MENNDLINAWKTQDNSKNKIQLELLEVYMQPKIRRVYWSFGVNLIATFLVILANISIATYNLFGYRSNPVMLGIEASLLVISIFSLLFGIFLYRRLKYINNHSKSLIELLLFKLSFIKTYYPIWLIVLSFSMLLLVFGVNTLVDNNNGFYQVNNMIFYIIIHAFVFVFIYMINRYLIFYNVHKLEVHLEDLRSDAINKSEDDEFLTRKRLPYLIVAIFLITLLIVLGIVIFTVFS